MQLKARVDDCLMAKCDPMKSRAEEIAKRLGIDQKDASAPKDYISSPEQLVKNKTWTMGEVIEYHGFEDCF